MLILNSTDNIHHNIKDFVKIDEYGLLQITGIVEKVYTHSQVLRPFLNTLLLQ